MSLIFVPNGPIDNKRALVQITETAYRRQTIIWIIFVFLLGLKAKIRTNPMVVLCISAWSSLAPLLVMMQLAYNLWSMLAFADGWGRLPFGCYYDMKKRITSPMLLECCSLNKQAYCFQNSKRIPLHWFCFARHTCIHLGIGSISQKMFY